MQFEPPSLKIIAEEKQFFRVTLEGGMTGKWQYAMVYTARKGSKIDISDPAQLIEKIYLDDRLTFTLGKNLIGRKKGLAFTFLDHYGRESQPIILHLKQINSDDPER
jgi:hypothetical protein